MNALLRGMSVWWMGYYYVVVNLQFIPIVCARVLVRTPTSRCTNKDGTTPGCVDVPVGVMCPGTRRLLRDGGHGRDRGHRSGGTQRHQGGEVQ